MARLHIHPIGLIPIFLALVGWVVALGGLGASTKDCSDENPSYSCAEKFQLEWWSIWFEFLLLLIVLLMSFTVAFERARLIFLVYLGMVTVLLTLTARNFITNSFSTGFDFGNRKSDAYAAAAAGSVIMCMMNFIIIIFVGLGASAAPSAASLSAPQPMTLGMGLGSTAAVEQKYQPGTYQPSNF